MATIQLPLSFDDITSTKKTYPRLNPQTVPAIGAEMASQVQMMKGTCGGKMGYEAASLLYLYDG